MAKRSALSVASLAARSESATRYRLDSNHGGTTRMVSRKGDDGARLGVAVRYLLFYPRPSMADALHDSVGTPLGTVQALLGHSSSEITRGVYLHSVPADARTAVEKVESLLLDANGPKWTQVLQNAKPGSPLIQ